MFHVKQYATGRPGEVSLPGDMRLRTNIFHNVILDVNAPSSRVTTFPSDLYGFVTIFNNTRFDFILIKGVVDNPLEIIGACPAYTLLTFPIDGSISNVFIRWNGTAGITERCKIFFTEENLGLVGQFRPPASPIISSIAKTPNVTYLWMPENFVWYHADFENAKIIQISPAGFSATTTAWQVLLPNSDILELSPTQMYYVQNVNFTGRISVRTNDSHNAVNIERWV